MYVIHVGIYYICGIFWLVGADENRIGSEVGELEGKGDRAIACRGGLSLRGSIEWTYININMHINIYIYIYAGLVFEGDATVVCSLQCDFPEDRSGWKVTSSKKEARCHLSSIKNELFLKGKSHRLVIFATVSEYDHLVLEMSKMTSISIWSDHQLNEHPPTLQSVLVVLNNKKTFIETYTRDLEWEKPIKAVKIAAHITIFPILR